MSYVAVVLAGGAGRRMGGVLKVLLPVGGESLLSRVLRAVGDAEQVVVVGPGELAAHLPAGVSLTQEQPPGGGPVAAIHAGFALLGDAERVAVVGGDLPFLTADALAVLRHNDGDVALFVDDGRRWQSMVSVWKEPALGRALDLVPGEGSSMRDLLQAADVAPVAWRGAGPPPWYDCDTQEDLARAEGML